MTKIYQPSLHERQRRKWKPLGTIKEEMHLLNVLFAGCLMMLRRFQIYTASKVIWGSVCIPRWQNCRRQRSCSIMPPEESTSVSGSGDVRSPLRVRAQSVTAEPICYLQMWGCVMRCQGYVSPIVSRHYGSWIMHVHIHGGQLLLFPGHYRYKPRNA
jgi:hypothetical protein